MSRNEALHHRLPSRAGVIAEGDRDQVAVAVAVAFDVQRGPSRRRLFG